ncbi:MAG: hypothetical protein WC924_03070 [Candidatus Gracilibacteria bacterium]
MSLPTNIRNAILSRERISVGTLVPTISTPKWGSIAEEIRATQRLSDVEIRRVIAVLDKYAPDEAFPEMADGSHAFVPLLRPLPRGRNGFFRCAVESDSEELSVKLILNMGGAITVHFATDIFPTSGELRAIRMHRGVNDGTSIDCTWEKRTNGAQALLTQMGWSVPGSTRNFFWAKGSGRDSMPTGAKGHKWAVQGSAPIEGSPLWIVGDLLK